MRTMYLADWVINAFNRDMGFDTFTVEQIAGDMLPGANLEQKIATGFHRNTMINLEGGVNQEEYRIAAVLDRANTTSTVWLGSTLACAQCHNHKYDPFSQKEYYEFVAFFNNSAAEIRQVQSFEAAEDSPKVEVPTEEQRRLIEKLDKKLSEVEAQYYRDTPELAKEQSVWESKVRQELVDWEVIHPIHARSVKGATLNIQNDGSILAEGVLAASDAYTVEAELDLTDVSAIRIEALADVKLPSRGPGRTGHGNFVLSELVMYAESADGEKRIQFADAKASFEAKVMKPARLLMVMTEPAGRFTPAKARILRRYFCDGRTSLSGMVLARLN